LHINVVRVASPALAGELVGRVLGPVAGDGLEGAIVATEGDLEADDRVARLNQFQVLRVDASLSGGGVVEQLNLLEEAGLAVLVQVGAGRFDSCGELSAEDVCKSGGLFGK